MNRPLSSSKDWEFDSLANSVSSFFERQLEESGNGKIVGKLAKRLTLEACAGVSYLEEEEHRDLSTDFASLPAIGEIEDNTPIVRTNDGKLYLRRFFEYEKAVAECIKSRISVNESPPCNELPEANFSSLDKDQFKAVKLSMKERLVFLTGGPGTGKTRTIVGIIVAHLNEDPETRIAMAAPTGKAAYRMRQSVLETMASMEIPESTCQALSNSIHSQTLHRLLGSVIGSVDFKRNRKSPLPYDLVIIDEASMIDLSLMAKLCEALRDDSKLILVGDADQLAPVLGGGVFSHLIKSSSKSGKLDSHIASLRTNHRRSGSPVAQELDTLCGLIRDGKGEDALAFVDSSSDAISMIESFDDISISQLLRDEFDPLISCEDPEHALSILERFRILCAHNQGRYGVEGWNNRVLNLFPDDMNQPLPVVINNNDYSLGLFNGDDGIILNNYAHFLDENGVRSFSSSRLPGHSVGYSTTVHRSQGSEFDKVLIVLPPEDASLLTRELLYVSVSRAKKGVALVGTPQALISAINQPEQSKCGVADLLK